MELPAQGHEAALRTAKPPTANARPWARGGGGGGAGASSSAPSATPPPPPKVYRVEPREFRDLVQRLTGAPPAALPLRRHPVQPQPVRAAADQQQAYVAAAPWFSFPMAGGGVEPAAAAAQQQPQHQLGAFL